MPDVEGFLPDASGGRQEIASLTIPHGEMWAQSDAEYQFASLCTPPAEVIGEQQPALLRVIDKALAAAVNQHERNAIITTGRVLEWQLFNPTGPPPEGVVLTDSEDNHGFIANDTRIPLTNECSVAARRRLQLAGLDTVTQAVRESLSPRKAEMGTVLLAAITESPEHALMESFTTRLPVAAAEKPLPPLVRDEREQKIRREGRASAALRDWEPLQTSPNARRFVRRGMQMLDDETIRQPNAAEDETTIGRARAYFLPHLVRAAQAEFGIQLRGFKRGVKDLILEGEGASAAEHRGEASAVIYRAVEDIMAGFAMDAPLAMHGVREGMLYDFICQIVDPENADSVQDIAAEVASHAATRAVDLVVNHTGKFIYDRDSEIEAQLRHTPVAEYVGRTLLYSQEIERHRMCNMRSPFERTGFDSRRNYESKKKFIVGRLSPESTDQLAGRVIMVQPAIAHVPDFIPGEHVVLEMSRNNRADFDANTEPFIPGYTLVSRSGMRFGFMRDTHDPYVPPDTPLGAELQEKAATQAIRMGMPGLAATIATHRNLTVEGLRAIIMGYADYVLPDYDSAPSDEDRPPRKIAATSLEDFAQLVTDGRMSQQCSIAADVQCMVLNELFGDGSSVTISGHTVDAKGNITAVTHRQTVFVSPDGRMYILDATPPSNDSTMPVPRQSGTPAAAADAPIQPGLKDLPSRSPHLLDVPSDDEIVRQRLQLAVTQLEARLQVVFRCHDPQALADHIAGLSKDDPARRTVEVMRMVVRGTATSEDMLGLNQYLRAMRTADADLLNRLHIPDYDLRILDMLIENTQRIQGYAFSAGVVQPPAAKPAGPAAYSGAATIETVERNVRIALEHLPQDELLLASEAVNRALDSIREALGVTTSAVADEIVSELDTVGHDLSTILARLRNGVRLAEEYRRSIMY